jgi:dipeptidyl aminopeptidase/acylaminoacyl peptidase
MSYLGQTLAPLRSILLLIVSSTYGFCVCHAEERGSVAGSNGAKAESATVKRPVTVTDFIQMTRLGDPQYNDGASSKGRVARYSPDGKRFVIVLRKGNLETNTNDYSLILFETDKVLLSPNPRVLLSMSSSSNRPAIQNVVWLDDSDTILFLGEHPGETTQLYSLKVHSKELRKLTNHVTSLSAFVVSPKGGEIVFVAENPEVPFASEEAARHGINVTNESLADLIAGRHVAGEYDDHTLFMKQMENQAEVRIATEGRVLAQSQMSLSPDGRRLVLLTEATHVPDAWTEYDDQFLKASMHPSSAKGARTSIFQYEIVDMPTRTDSLLLDAPIQPNGWSEAVWSPDSRSVILSDMYLPLNIDDIAERALRKAHAYLTEVRIPSRQIVRISDEDLRLLDWDAITNVVSCDVGTLDSLNGKATRRAYFRKTDDTWSMSPKYVRTAHSQPEIVLDEDMNQPPRIFAVDPDTGRKALLIDLNPQFRTLALARVEEIIWETSRHNEVKGGLYWPVGFVVGKRYPLVIQTHGWSSDRFWIDGPWTTAFAAQALAGQGVFVLQVDDSPSDLHLYNTPKEVPAAVAAYDSAIDLLERKGLIDRDRIGITGFSRTYLYVTYALIYSRHHFAAADVADGVDYGYFQYMVIANGDQMIVGSYDLTNGAPPFGKGLLKWLKVSPAFLMDKIETPLRIQTLAPSSLLVDWPWFSGLTRLGKPVEMVYLPEGTHILEKPWDRMISQQGNVDWFCFWLKDAEDPDPAKAEQYTRWHSLRSLSGKATPNMDSR